MLVRSQLGIIIAASLAGLLFGFDTAVISGVTQALRTTFELSPAGLGMAVSSALWGTLLGALTLGKPGDRFGSRDVLKFVAALYMAGALGCALAWNLPSFLVFRFLTGIAIGGSSVLAPVYIAEVAPAEQRGARVGLFQVNIVVGILVAYVSNFLVAQAFAGPDVWRWKLAVAALPALAFLLLLFCIPQSPRWLAAVQASTGAPRESLSWQRHRKPILLAIGLGMFNQLSGINAILYYLGDIFSAAGFNSLSANVQSIAIGATNLCATLVALTLIDKSGRKRLLLIGSVLTALAQGGVAVVLALNAGRALLLPLLILFIAAFALSQGAVIWVYLSEIFPTAVRARGQGLGSATHWIMNALIAGLFPTVAAYSQALPFVFFSAMMLLQLILVLRYLPETKGVSLESMERTIGA